MTIDSAKRTVLVLGASGKTGRRIVPRLRLRGLEVRAASRTSSTPFDWADPGTWNPALAGASAAYVIAPTQSGQVHEFVARATAAGVRHLVLLSGRGADTWGDATFGLEMRAAEDAVRGSALKWTILRPNNFDQNFDEELFHGPVLAGELALPAADVPEPFIDIEDVADVAATVLAEPAGHAGRTYELSGPRAVTFGEAVDLIGRAAGRPVVYTQISPADYVAALVQTGFDDDDARHLADMYAIMAQGLIAEPTDGVEQILGRPARTFEDYVVRAASAGAWDR